MSHTKGKMRSDGIHVYIGDKCIAEMDAAYHFDWDKPNAGGGKGCSVAQISPDEMKDNAARIALCWNSHDKLLEAAKELLRAKKIFDGLDASNPDCGPEVLRYEMAVSKLKAAIAEGEPPP